MVMFDSMRGFADGYGCGLHAFLRRYQQRLRCFCHFLCWIDSRRRGDCANYLWGGNRINILWAGNYDPDRKQRNNYHQRQHIDYNYTHPARKGSVYAVYL